MPTRNKSDYFMCVLKDCMNCILKVFIDHEDYS